jgi:hypothetical protein
MKCQDVRRTLSLFVDGQPALTEWAIIQGHLLECAECSKELNRLRALADPRARVKHRRGTGMIVAAMAVVLVAAGGGGFLIYQGGFPDLPSWGTASAPPLADAPATPALELANPVAPVPGPHPVPAPAARPSPPPARPKGTGEATPPPAAEPTPRATRPAALAEVPGEDRMPTQARPVPPLTAPPDAEAMPTQGGPARPVPRGRP